MTAKEITYWLRDVLEPGKEMKVETKDLAKVNAVLDQLNKSGLYKYEFGDGYKMVKKKLT